MYLNDIELATLRNLLKTYFALPYSNDLSGKDAEALLRIAKGAPNKLSKKKELFDIIDGAKGYSVKTLSKSPSATRVDLQEQRFCAVEQVRELQSQRDKRPAHQGRLLLEYIHNRIREQMLERGVTEARSLILLKHRDKNSMTYRFRYWEEDFFGWIQKLVERNEREEIEWVILPGGLHGRDKCRQDDEGTNVRLIRMHYKHNQIFTDHDIPQGDEVVSFDFTVNQLSWSDVAEMLERGTEPLASVVKPLGKRGRK